MDYNLCSCCLGGMIGQSQNQLGRSTFLGMGFDPKELLVLVIIFVQSSQHILCFPISRLANTCCEYSLTWIYFVTCQNTCRRLTMWRLPAKLLTTPAQTLEVVWKLPLITFQPASPRENIEKVAGSFFLSNCR